MYFKGRNILSVWNRLRWTVYNITYWTHFFWWSSKKCDKCIQMHYIGKSYVTTVTMEKNLITLKKKVLQVYANALHREKLCNHCIQVWRWLLVTKTCSRSLRFPSHFWSYAVIGCWGVLVASLLLCWLHTGDKP